MDQTLENPFLVGGLATVEETEAKPNELPLPDWRGRLGLHVQRTVDRLMILPFCGAIAFVLRWVRGYVIEDMPRLRREYAELTKDGRPMLICMNHLTFIDSVLLIWAMSSNWRYALKPRTFTWNLPAGDFFKKKLRYRIVAKLCKCIFIHRDGSKDHKSKILGICRYLLMRREVITIFPEGKRSRTGIFDPKKIAYGAGRLILAVPETRLLCVYLRADKQTTYSNYPPKNSRIHVSMRVVEPVVTSARLGHREIVTQVASELGSMEQAYFAQRGMTPTPAVGFGKAALITGASEGIGRALAEKFAAKGYDVVLVGRNAERLTSLADACTHKHGAHATVFTCDLSQAGAVDDLVQKLNLLKVPVEVLVNNAGFGVNGDFAKTDLNRELELVHTQIDATMKLTKWALKGMTERKKGKILNVASVYSYVAVPKQAIYGACKAFLESFTESVAQEVSAHNIQVSLLCPGVTRTEFRKRAGMSKKETGMTPEKVATIAYYGLNKGRRIIIPGAVNRLFVGVMRHLSGKAGARLMVLINGARGVNH